MKDNETKEQRERRHARNRRKKERQLRRAGKPKPSLLLPSEPVAPVRKARRAGRRLAAQMGRRFLRAALTVGDEATIADARAQLESARALADKLDQLAQLNAQRRAE